MDYITEKRAGMNPKQLPIIGKIFGARTNTFFRKRVKRKKQNTQRRQHQRKKIPVIYLILLQLTKIFIFQLIILYFNSNQINKLFNNCDRFTLFKT